MGVEGVFDGDDIEPNAEALCELLGIALRRWSVVGPGHRHPPHRLWADGIDRDHRGERRVDAATQAHDDAGEVVLADVIP